MLFMGCKKYPDENEYDQFLDNHGGSSNATTDMETVSFKVAINLFEALLLFDTDLFVTEFAVSKSTGCTGCTDWDRVHGQLAFSMG